MKNCHIGDICISWRTLLTVGHFGRRVANKPQLNSRACSSISIALLDKQCNPCRPFSCFELSFSSTRFLCYIILHNVRRSCFCALQSTTLTNTRTLSSTPAEMQSPLFHRYLKKSSGGFGTHCSYGPDPCTEQLKGKTTRCCPIVAALQTGGRRARAPRARNQKQVKDQGTNFRIVVHIYSVYKEPCWAPASLDWKERSSHKRLIGESCSSARNYDRRAEHKARGQKKK